MNQADPIPDDFRLDAYSYELPEQLIAQEPSTKRDGSRLLVVDRADNETRHRSFRDIADELVAGDLLVMNDTRVLPARTTGIRRETGGKVEVLLFGSLDGEHIEALLGTRGKPQVGEVFELLDGRLRLELVERGNRGHVTLRKVDDQMTGDDIRTILEEHGRLPLPPYIHRDPDHDARDAIDHERYQTVYAEKSGASAAPTAGLHITESLLDALVEKGVKTAFCTLHVGLGTFQPITAEDIRSHVMHSEEWHVPDATAELWRNTRMSGGRILAVGTTSLRALESAYDPVKGEVRSGRGRTRLFLYPGVPVHSIDGMITNFHLPRSSLLLLVSALCGRQRVLDLYEEAIRERYRFFSYGDAMLIC